MKKRKWKDDILSCIFELNIKEFTLDDMYRFEKKLQKLHPDNQHVRDKIRQQLQHLRDEGILEFIDYNGTYSLILFRSK